MSILDDIRKRLSQARSSFDTSANNAINNGVSAVGNAIGGAIHNFQQPLTAQGAGFTNNTPFNPTSNGGDNFWNSPVAQGIGIVQQATAPLAQIPHFNFADKIRNPVLNFAAQIPQGILNTPSNAYSAGNKIGTDINSGDIYKPRTLLADVAKAADPLLNAATLGIGGGVAKQLGKQTLKDIFKEGLWQGGKVGLGFGAIGGLQSGENISDPTQYATNLAKSTVLGGVTGAALGGATAGGSKLAIDAIKSSKDALQQQTSKQLIRDLNLGTDRVVNHPDIKPMLKAMNIDPRYEHPLMRAVDTIKQGYIDNPEATKTIKTLTDTYMPQFSNKPITDQAKIWEHLNERKNELTPSLNQGEINSLGLKPFNDAVLNTSGKTVRQGGAIDFNAPVLENKPKVSNGKIGKLENRLNELTGFQSTGDNWKQQYYQRNAYVDNAMQSAPPEVQAEIQSINKQLNDIRGNTTPEVVNTNPIQPEGNTNVGGQMLPKDGVTNPLAQEALKYKSAEELKPINTVNPTGSLFVDYTPESRMKAPLAQNMTTLSETSKKSPDTVVTIYRGVSKNHKEINPGDFITTDPNLAKSYGENIISKKVKLGNILDDIESPMSGEYLYRPGASKELQNVKYDYKQSDWYKNYSDFLSKNPDKFPTVDSWLNGMKASGKTKAQLTDIYNQAHGVTVPQTLPPEPGLVPPEVQTQQTPLPNQTVDQSLNGSIPQTTTPLSSILKPKVETPLPLQPRGFTTSVKDATNVIDPVKTDVNAAYTSKPNDVLMGEAKLLLQDGAKLDLNKVKNVDQKVAATIQEAINQQGTNPQLAANLFNNLSEQGTELGRGVQAFSLLKNMSPESIALSTAGKIKKYNLTAIKKIPEMTGDQVQLINDKIAAMDGLAQGSRERNIAYNDLQTTMNNFIPSSLADKAITVWKAGLLTSLRTHERNLVGNGIMSASEIAKDPIATVADKLMGLRTGKRTVTTTLRGMFDGAKKGTNSALDIVKYGYDPSADISKFDQNHITWNNNPVEQFLKKATGAVFNTLGAEDQVFWHSSYARSMYDQAGAEAMNAGQKGNRAFIENLVHNPTPDMATTALNDANYATFHDKTKLSGVANAIKRAAVDGGGIKGEVGKVVTNVLMPFTGVPSSIVGKTMAYSPIGLVKGAVTAGRVLAGQVPELQRQAAQEIGRGVIGTSLFGIGAYLMSKGLMTGQPKDIKESDLWAAQGKQANSVMIGGQWRSIGSIGPQNLIMLAGAKAQEELQSPDGSPANYALGLGKDQLSQTFLAGVQGPLNALTDPNRYGKQYVGGLASSVIPNIVKDTARAFDPNQRENNTIQDYVTNSIPGLRNNNIPSRDVLGNIKPQSPTGAGAFFDLFNSKTPIDNVVTNELGRLNDSGNSAIPSKIKNTQTIGKDKIKLTFEQLNTLEKGVGEVLKPQLTTLISSPVYQSMDDEHKAKAIGDLVSNVRSNYKNINGPDIVANNPVADTSKPATDQLSSTTSNTKTTDKSTSLSYVDSNGAYKTITIKKPSTSPTNNYQKAIQEAETFKQLDKVISNNDLSTSDKSSLINTLGISQGDADYYTISSETKPVRDGYVQDELQAVKTPQELYPKLIGWRRQINGKMVLSNPMVDDLAKQGVISKAEAKALKNVSYTGDMNSKQTSGNIANQLNSSSGSTGGSGSTAKMQKAYKDLINSITKSAAKPKSSAEAINNVLKYTKGSKSNTANNAGSLKSVLASKGKTLDSIFNYKVKA